MGINWNQFGKIAGVSAVVGGSIAACSALTAPERTPLGTGTEFERGNFDIFTSKPNSGRGVVEIRNAEGERVFDMKAPKADELTRDLDREYYEFTDGKADMAVMVSWRREQDSDGDWRVFAEDVGTPMRIVGH